MAERRTRPGCEAAGVSVNASRSRLSRGAQVTVAVVAGMVVMAIGTPGAAAVSFGITAAGSFGFGEPYDVERADINVDGRLDVVVAADVGGVHVFLGRPDGGLQAAFAAPAPFFGDRVTSVGRPADITGDGKLDIVYAQRGSDQVVVRAGDGNGGFGAAVSTSMANVSGVDTGMFDGDERADVIAGWSSTLDGGYTVLHAQASGALTAGSTVTFPGARVDEVRTGDVNSDAISDAVLSTTAGFRVGIGDQTPGGLPAGSLTFGVPFDGPLGVGRLLLADFNADGRDDLATSRLNNNPDIFETRVRVALPSGGLSAPVEIPGGWHSGIDAGDIDDDGVQDLILTQSTDGVRVAYGVGSGSFEDHTVYPVDPPGDQVDVVRLLSLAVGDLDLDGVDDIVTSENFNVPGRLLVLRNAPFATFDQDPVDFGSVSVGATTQRTLTIGNEGVPDLDIRATTVEGAAFAKSADSCTGDPLATGGSCKIDLAFAPESGEHEGLVIIESDDPDAVVGVELVGIGVPIPVEQSTTTPPVAAAPTTSATPAPPTAAQTARRAAAAAVRAIRRAGLRGLVNRPGVRFTFFAPSSVVDVRLTSRSPTPGARRRTVLARARIRLRSPERATMTLRPTPAGRRAARRHRTTPATIQVTVTPVAGTAARASRAVTVPR